MRQLTKIETFLILKSSHLLNLYINIAYPLNPVHALDGVSRAIKTRSATEVSLTNLCQFSNII